MGLYYSSNEFHKKSQSPEEKWTILRNFYISRHGQNELEIFDQLALYDLCRHSRPKKLPEWLSTSLNLKHRQAINDFFDLPETIPTLLPEYSDEKEPKKVQKMAHLQVFSLHPVTLEQKETAILFNYRRPDLLGNAKESFVSIW